MSINTGVPGYESLAAVLQAAYDQAAKGKGNERHAGGQPFDEQPMQVISDLLGNVDGMAFQAIKKIREARGLPTVEAQVRELLGAINYCAGMVVYLQAQASVGDHPADTEFRWIPWTGGECPVPPNCIVEYKMRGGQSSIRRAGELIWKLDGVSSEIVAYRVAKVVPQAEGAGQ